MSRPYELVIFDCDGVLVDSERLAVRVEVQVLAAMGWEITEQEIADRFVGRSHAYMTEQLSLHLGRELAPDWDHEFSHLYRSAFEAELVPVPGIEEALDAIGTAACVASSGTHDKMRFTLGLTGLYERFEGRIFSAEEVPNGKPAPDLFLYAARRMGVEPGRCAVVEDSTAGCDAARRAGMDAYAYTGGSISTRGLDDTGAVLFDDMTLLPKLLAGR